MRSNTGPMELDRGLLLVSREVFASLTPTVA